MIDGISPTELALLAGALLIAGALTGILAGVFGVGGGAIIVPVLYELFRIMDVPEATRTPLAVGTSLAIIIPTSIRSWRAHQARGATDSDVLKSWAIPVVIGVLVGSALARYAPPAVFKLVFVMVAGLSAARLLGGFQWRIGSEMPKGPILNLYGLVIGVLSALMGIGGGQLSTMVMTLYGRPIHQAVATSAGMGILISIPGAIGYMLAGLGKSGLPPFSIGFVSLFGLLIFAPVSILTAPLGVRLAHALSKRKLEVAFGCFLLLVSLRFLMSLLGF